MRDCGRSADEVAQEIVKAWTTLAPALGIDLHEISQEVTQGVSHLFCSDNEFYFVLRKECRATGPELVIVAAAGKNATKHVSEIHLKAKADGFKSVRLHTLKPDAMLRLGAKSLGYAKAETILRAEL
ncbi:hypothetical protein EXU30_00075 [Shewanella maritima]|uniref:Uncharacterized protein n=2 Tax=Shewanella maritima TaxID=2520507 RepID=A0A411PMF9_9GAMM|nr:hypothetical protein EXU30_00075 [Shewanella maritima]